MLAIEEMLIFVLSLRNTNTVFLLSAHTQTRAHTHITLLFWHNPNVMVPHNRVKERERERERVQSIVWLICFFSFSKNNTNQSACGMLREKEGFTYTRKHSNKYTQTNTRTQMLSGHDITL